MLVVAKNPARRWAPDRISKLTRPSGKIERKWRKKAGGLFGVAAAVLSGGCRTALLRPDRMEHVKGRTFAEAALRVARPLTGSCDRVDKMFAPIDPALHALIGPVSNPVGEKHYFSWNELSYLLQIK